MANGQAELLRQVHQLFSVGRVGDLADAELLARFIAQRDEPAFEALVRRHGAMVLRVCQGVLHDKHAAEDAFQATFLVLAHKAHGLHVGETLGRWLHGVALRVAKKARSQNARRHRRERASAVTTAWEPNVDPDRSDTEALLHEEVDRLPESYRSPIVLCYLQGLSYEMAATQLGISEGTIRGRLARARDRLRIRLTRRGVVVPAGLLIAGNAWTSASAAVPNGLIDAAVKGALPTVAGKVTVSASVMVLTKGVLRAMFMTKFKVATTALLLASGGLLASKPLLLNPQANAADATLPAPESATRRGGFAAPDPRPTQADRDDGGGANDEPTLVVETNPKPWETSVRIKIHKSGPIGFGSGTVIKSTPEESLILTCAHQFKVDGEPNRPPERFPHKVTVDLFDGVLHTKSKPQIHFVETVEAETMDYDFDRDVGLIRIRPGRRLPASRVVPSSWAAQPRMKMFTVGCSEGNDATAWSTSVIKSGVKLFENSVYEAIECQFAPKQGRSGGGLYTEDGYLAGVSNFAEPRGDRGFYATPHSIYHLLARNGLASLYAEEELPTKESRKQTPETSRPSSSPVLSEVELDPLIQIAENLLRNGDHQGARATTDRLNSQLRRQQEALRSKLEHLDSLARRSTELRRVAERNSSPPTPTRDEPGLTPPPPDHEQRLRDIERKLDRLLGEKERASQGVE